MILDINFRKLAMFRTRNSDLKCYKMSKIFKPFIPS